MTWQDKEKRSREEWQKYLENGKFLNTKLNNTKLNSVFTFNTFTPLTEKYDARTYAYYGGGYHNCAVELKYRAKYSYGQFDTVYLECKKREDMIREADPNAVLLYVSMFNDGYATIHSIRAVKDTWVKGKKMLPKSNSDLTLIEKEVYFLPTNEAVIVRYEQQ